jgi:hypothetical protein
VIKNAMLLAWLNGQKSVSANPCALQSAAEADKRRQCVALTQCRPVWPDYHAHLACPFWRTWWEWTLLWPQAVQLTNPTLPVRQGKANVAGMSNWPCVAVGHKKKQRLVFAWRLLVCLFHC